MYIQYTSNNIHIQTLQTINNDTNMLCNIHHPITHRAKVVDWTRTKRKTLVRCFNLHLQINVCMHGWEKLKSQTKLNELDISIECVHECVCVWWKTIDFNEWTPTHQDWFDFDFSYYQILNLESIEWISTVDIHIIPIISVSMCNSKCHIINRLMVYGNRSNRI